MSLETFAQPLRTFLTSKEDRQSLFINPVFVGYKPVVWTTIEKTTFPESSDYCLHFHNDDLFFDPVAWWKGFPADNHSVARMAIRQLPLKFESCPDIKIFQGQSGQHKFLHPLHRATNSIRDRLKKSRPGNIDLAGNLHDMVRIAYALPRVISLISVTDGSRMNLFPTDLHGQLDNKFYISSLRLGGKAQEQVQEQKKIVISEVNSDQFDQAYDLGKNHMKDLADHKLFRLSPVVSETFRFPLPHGVLRYFELVVLDFLDVGIHRIFLYQIVNIGKISDGKTLSHIHQYYAQWRSSRGIATELLLRTP